MQRIHSSFSRGIVSTVNRVTEAAFEIALSMVVGRKLEVLIGVAECKKPVGIANLEIAFELNLRSSNTWSLLSDLYRMGILEYTDCERGRCYQVNQSRERKIKDFILERTHTLNKIRNANRVRTTKISASI